MQHQNLTLLKKDFLEELAIIIPPPSSFSKPLIIIFFFLPSTIHGESEIINELFTKIMRLK